MSWLDNIAEAKARRSNQSTAACNWMQEILNVWNTNEACTMNVGMVLAYLTNYLTKKEVSSDDVKQALRNAEIHFR